jgi:hypothetical protein
MRQFQKESGSYKQKMKRDSFNDNAVIKSMVRFGAEEANQMPIKDEGSGIDTYFEGMELMEKILEDAGSKGEQKETRQRLIETVRKITGKEKHH